MKNTAAAAVLLAFPALASAADGLSYDFVEAAYVTVKPDEGDADTDGFGVKLSRLLGQSVYFAGSIATSKADDVHIPDVSGTDDFNGSVTGLTLTAGLGGRTPVGEATDVVYGVSLLFAQIEGDGISGVPGENDGSAVDDDDVGYAANVGLRSRLGPVLEGNLGVGYASVFDASDTSYGVGLVMHLGEAFAVSLGGETNGDVKAYTLGARFNF